MTHLIVTLGQMNISFGNPGENLNQVRRMAEEAGRRNSDFLVLPELWSTGYDLQNTASHSTRIDEGIFSEIGLLARKNNLHIVGSCLSKLGSERYGNTAVLHDPDGKAAGVYSKVHLFRLMDEDLYLTAGTNRTLVKTKWGKCGLAICYDLRFPEFIRHYALDGAKILFLPSEWPYPRLSHWRILLRARAIENQMFVVACNRVGKAGETTFFGHSCIIDPWGETVIEAGDSEALLTVSIDISKVDQVRREIPVFSDRQIQAY